MSDAISELLAAAANPKLPKETWEVDTTKALGTYGIWTSYETHKGHDGEGYPSQLCSFNVIQQERAVRDAIAAFIAAARNGIRAMVEEWTHSLRYAEEAEAILSRYWAKHSLPVDVEEALHRLRCAVNTRRASLEAFLEKTK